MTTSKALVSTIALTVGGTMASGCTLFKRDNAQSAANTTAEAVRDDAQKAADAAEETAENRAEAVREAGENASDTISNGVTNNADTMANTAAGVTNGTGVDAATRAENTAEQRADGIERAGEQRSGTLRDHAEVLAEAIEKCPVIGLRDSKKYFVATRESGDYLLNASKGGTYSCFTSENEAKQAGFLATAATGRKAQ